MRQYGSAEDEASLVPIRRFEGSFRHGLFPSPSFVSIYVGPIEIPGCRIERTVWERIDHQCNYTIYHHRQSISRSPLTLEYVNAYISVGCIHIWMENDCLESHGWGLGWVNGSVTWVLGRH